MSIQSIIQWMMIGISIVLLSGQSAANLQNRGMSLQPATPDNYELVWSDEFDYEGLPDDSKWSYDVGDGCPDLCGWGNNEQQYYAQNRLENTRVQDGHLIITARKESYKSAAYTSARLLTRNKMAWTYGRIEVKAKLPLGRGTWPAIWMLPEEWVYGGWPSSGEIDIMEHVGHEPNRIYATAHTEAFNHSDGTQNTDTLRVPDAEHRFHRYAIEWTPDAITWFVDDKQYAVFKNRRQTYKEWPFDQPFHLILNIAVGGNWGGQEGIDDTIWPQEMVVDYVRIYQKE
ncbi:glycoside hydrolase family 16 protein [Fodinibius salsisoli]|uniref:Glycoside hydrolase family 16 protein n=1 Tax=Fodinibius salsisoli TaxID=2820877 RepID=A0ABT3PKF9_9BACT|nr:glycoside hydrolase family 16 protein [Fodinibius salsisoli]MCW9706425.1 glycoside hydrolase family 16 protein [Fodinibius salsisoli]